MIGILGNKTGWKDEKNIFGMLNEHYVHSIHNSIYVWMNNIGCGLLKTVQVMYVLLFILCINCLFRYKSALKLLLVCVCVWRVFRNSNGISAWSIQWNNESLYFIFYPSQFVNESLAIFLWHYELHMNYGPTMPKLKTSKWKNVCVFTFGKITTNRMLPET